MIAALVVTGLVWLWVGGGPRGSERASEPWTEAPPEASPDERSPREELVPARAPLLEPAGADEVEIEPFAPARASPTPPSARLGSLRGHVEVSGEEPFPLEWRLVARPSATLAGRELVVERSLEFLDGRQDFELRELPLGAYDVFGEASGFNGQVLAVRLEPGNEHPFVNLRLVPAGVLEGRILDAQGLPAEGLTVTLFALAHGAEREAVTDVNGVYRFEQLTDGAYELLFGKASSPLIPERRPLRFMAPRLTFPDVELPPMGAIRVRAVDSLARPLEGVDVRGSGTNGGVVEGRTDFAGLLLARHLPAGHFRLRLEHPALGREHARRIAVDVVAGQIVEAPVRLGP